MTLTDEDIKTIDKFEQIMNRGFFASGTEVTDLYNRVFGTKLSSTNCSSCIRSRVQKLVQAMNVYLAQLELPKEKEEKQVVEKEENKQEEKKEETTNGTGTHTSGEQGVTRKKRSKKANANG